MTDPRHSESPQRGEIHADRVNFVTIGEDCAGQRLDNYLMRVCRGVPKGHVYRIVRNGEVRVNKGRTSVDYRLEAGDVVRVPPMRLARREAPAAAARPIEGGLPVLFEDEHLLVVDKPSGLACHGGSGISFGLIERMRASRPAQPFLELVHRLDRDTSGALILAKTRRALVGLHEQIREGKTRKRYQTLVKGDWVNDVQHARFPLHKYVTASGERRVRVDAGLGLPSHSIFYLKERFGAASFLEVLLLTGRTHQIRVHAAELGFPLVGDDKYGDFAFNKAVAAGSLGVPLRRMFLHAASISFAHPVTGEPLEVVSALPRECEDLLEALRHAGH